MALALRPIYGFLVLDCYLSSPPVHIFPVDFSAPVLSPLFNLATPFLGVPLYMAHPDPISPHQAQPPVVPHYPVQPKSFESDPPEMMDSSSSSSAPDARIVPVGPGTINVIVNGFLSLESV